MKDFFIKYWLQTLFGIILSILSAGMKKMAIDIKREMMDQRSIKLGIQAILRDRLIQSYNYHVNLGHCEIHDRDNITNMYNQYHTLGANGVIDGLIKELLNLPVTIKM